MMQGAALDWVGPTEHYLMGNISVSAHLHPKSRQGSTEKTNTDSCYLETTNSTLCRYHYTISKRQNLRNTTTSGDLLLVQVNNKLFTGIS